MPGPSSPETSSPDARVLSPPVPVAPPWTRPPWHVPGRWWVSRATSPFIPSPLMDAAEVINSYHELWHVEASFRMSKHDLPARPVLHHTRDATGAHLTVVMAALAVARHLQGPPPR